MGQQCTPSEQHTAFGRGQQPYEPSLSLQHVLPEGHSDLRSAHITLLFIAGTCFEAGIVSEPSFVHPLYSTKLNNIIYFLRS